MVGGSPAPHLLAGQPAGPSCGGPADDIEFQGYSPPLATRGGDTGITLLGKSGRPRVQVDSSGLKIFNASGSVVGIFGFHSDGTMGASVADKSGKLKRIDIEKKPDATK